MTGPGSFRWFPSIPSRNVTTRCRQGDTPVRVTFLTVLGYVRIEELDQSAMPCRTLAQIDVAGRGYGLPEVETLITGLGVIPADPS